MDGEGVRHLDPRLLHLIHPDRPTTPGQDALPRLLMRPLLLRLNGHRKRENVGGTTEGIKTTSRNRVGKSQSEDLRDRDIKEK